MSSAVSDFKHAAQDGYFLTTSTDTRGYYISTAASGAGGSYVQPVLTPLAAGVEATRLALAGVILRDLGKTVTTGGLSAAVNSATNSVTATPGVPTRVFRKVQMLNGPGTTVASNVGNGVTGNAADLAASGMYQSFYVELPTLGDSGGTTENRLASPLAYIPSLPGLYV